MPARRELQPRERVDRDGVWIDPAHVAERRLGRLPSSRPQTRSQRPGRSARGSALDRERDRPRIRLDHPGNRPGERREIHRSSSDEFAAAAEGLTERDRLRMHERTPTMTLDNRAQVARALGALPRRPDDRAGRHDRERRPSLDPGRPRLLADVAGLGRERVPAHLRRLPPPRRAGWATCSVTGGCS